MIDKVWGSASLDVEMFHMGDHADAWPAFGFHLVEVFKAGKVSSGVWSSGFSGLLADWVSSSDIIDAGDLHGFGALLGTGEEGQEGQNSKDEHGSHCRLMINYWKYFNSSFKYIYSPQAQAKATRTFPSNTSLRSSYIDIVVYLIGGKGERCCLSIWSFIWRSLILILRVYNH